MDGKKCDIELDAGGDVEIAAGGDLDNVNHGTLTGGFVVRCDTI
jgi:hypothetical protein